MIYGPRPGEIGSGRADRGAFRDRSDGDSVPRRNNHSGAGSRSKALAYRVSRRGYPALDELMSAK